MQIQLYGKKIFIYKSPVDFRKSIEGLSYLVGTVKQGERDSIFLFYNRNRDKIKCLSWHKNGFLLLQKRLECGKFSMYFDDATGVVTINTQTLSWLLAGLDWQKMCEWDELDYNKFS